jgi:hypothetical protein
MSDVRWLYKPSGEATHYQVGDNIYRPNGKHDYYVSGTTVFDAKTGNAAFYISDNWLFTMDGQQALYYSNP